MSRYDVIVKNVEPQLVASIRDILPSYQHIGRLFGELYTYLQRYRVDGLTATIWHDTGYKARDVDGEAAIYLKQCIPETKRVRVYELPAVQAASTIHQGTYNTLTDAYTVILQWIEANGYKIIGPNRELYLHCTIPVRQDDPSYVTEIQFPISKL